ncbi:MAG TPA: 50S ribosomal protein L11 methyltransferase, partial [Candidatus Saccharimonadales bacterium]|nr:50S ribosomal protein L11 methyltransferase [Candidatus Saccharimonadales bacterium]
MKAVRQLRRISITTTPEAEDAVSTLLNSTLGLPPSVYFESETGVSTVTVYLQQKSGSLRQIREEISAGLKRIRNCGLKIGPGKIGMTRIRRKDWAESWKRHFKPMEIGSALLIKPSWSKRKPRKREQVIVLDPGLSFGTGHHPTTAFCLSEIAAARKRRNRCSQAAAITQSFLDLGTGSGILAIAAAKLGYSPVHAVDCDPESIRVASANAHANRVHRKLKIRYADLRKLPIRPRHRYDLICANLISTLLINERRRITAHLNHAGMLVVAGVLKSEFAQVKRAFEILRLKLVASQSRKE